MGLTENHNLTPNSPVRRISRLPFTSPASRAVIPLAVLLLWVIAAARIVSTYSVFNQTWDEGAHVAAGMEWLDLGKYTYEELHPPLARVAVALGPYLSGLRSTGEKDMWKEGNEILYSQSRYGHNLALARLGVLPFFLLATCIVWIWARLLFGDVPALLAVLFFTTLPPVLAHAGSAATDTPLTGTFMAALLAFMLWMRGPTMARSLLLGFCGGMAVISKFSACLFLPACGLAMLGCQWAWVRFAGKPVIAYCRRTLIAAGVALAIALVTIWAGYRFSVAPLTSSSERPHKTIDHLLGTSGRLHDLGYSVAEGFPIPAPALFMGLNRIRSLGSIGRESYLLGEIRQTGWWYYFPVVLGVKTPIPFLFLSLLGLGLLAREARASRDWRIFEPGAAALALFAVCMWSKVNIGVRHILPIYPLLAIVAAFSVVKLWETVRYRAVARAAVVGLLASQLVSSALAHPDYLAYFNAFANSHPDRILVDSDLDWGQDLLRLSAVLRAKGIRSLSIAYNGSADLTRHDLPPFRKLIPYEQTTGWIAISERKLKMGEGLPPYQGFSWLKAYKPVEIVGRSIRLYYVPENTGNQPPRATRQTPVHRFERG